jgi:rhamnogalacturonyl hydrolase YesR
MPDHTYKAPRWRVVGVCALLMVLAVVGRGPSLAADGAAPELPGRKALARWGLDALARSEADFALPERGLYADAWKRGQSAPGSPAFMWGCGVQLSALAAAARLDPPAYTPRLKQYADALNVYWSPGANGIGGYDVLPGPKSPDRYYDDNMWMVLALAEVYEVTRDPKYLERAEATFTFVLSGEDDTLGGGIYWHEQEKKSKNACSNGPAAAAALRLYEITRKRAYLDAGKRLYAWTNAHLQDTDGLYWDNMRLDGTLERTKWSYNTALMLRANCLLYAMTLEARYRDEAERLARAAEARWVRPATGAIADGGAFAHLLSEAFLFLSERDGNPHWRDVALRALAFLHDQARDSDGHYGERWDAPVSAPLDRVKLLSQASAARAFLVAAWPAARAR